MTHGWQCGRCGQLNSHWAVQCGRCDTPKEAPPRKRGKRARSPLPRAQRAATARQTAFLDAVAALTLELERAPNAVEVAARVGCSKQGARGQLEALEKKGLLCDVPKTVSSGQWALTAAGEAARPEPSFHGEHFD